MAGTSINIDNTLEAINNDIIPGSFSDDNKSFIFPVINYKNKRGTDLEWFLELKFKQNDKYISIDKKFLDKPLIRLSDNYVVELIVHSKQKDGKERKVNPTFITTGKNIGKKNETNVLTQGFRDALSLYNKHSNKNKIVSFDIKPPPMLIQWLNSSKLSSLSNEDFEKGITLQRKFNGVRYVTYLSDGEIVIQYSRTGNDYFPSNYLNIELKKILLKRPIFMLNKYGINSNDELDIYNNKNNKLYLDGELYLHNKSLSYISGQARKETNKDLLNYYVFDIFFPYAISKNYNMISKYRQEYLTDLFNLNNLTYVKKVENFKVRDIKEINILTNKFIKEKYEGSIARKDFKEYEYSYNNYHSPNLVKIKPVYSDEFEVVGFTEGKKGKDKGKLIWICKVNKIIDDNDTLFNVVPNLSLKNRENLYKCLSEKINSEKTRFDRDVKGLFITIEYSELSNKTNKPLQAKAIAFRTYESSNDIIINIYKDCKII